MYPDLSYFFHDLFGIPVDNWASIFKTYGLFLVLAILVAAYLLNLELRRKAEEGLFQPAKVKQVIGKGVNWFDIFSNLLFGFVLGFKLVYVANHFQDFQLDPAGIAFSTKGSWLGGLIGGLSLAGFSYWEVRKKQLPKPVTEVKEIYPHHRLSDITIIAAISGVVGAKVFDIIEHLPAFFEDPLGMFFSGSGLAIYGGLIGGFIGVYIYLKRKGIPPIHVMDAVAPSLMIAYGIGRLGCHFSGDGDWGIANELAQPSWWIFPDWLWSYEYPNNVTNRNTLLEMCDPAKYKELLANRRLDMVERCVEACGIRYCHKLSPGVFPTSVYEVVAAVGLGGILWGLRKKLVIPGMLFFVYLMFNGLERFTIEKIRVNQRYELLGLEVTQAEIISTCLFLTGLIGCLVLWRRR